MQYSSIFFSILDSRVLTACRSNHTSRGNVSLVHSRAWSHASDGNPTKLDSAPVPMQLHMGAPQFPSRLEDREQSVPSLQPDLCNLAPGGSAHNEGIFKSITCHEPQPRKRKRAKGGGTEDRGRFAKCKISTRRDGGFAISSLSGPTVKFCFPNLGRGVRTAYQCVKRHR
jgi:hypothetical protein